MLCCSCCSVLQTKIKPRHLYKVVVIFVVIVLSEHQMSIFMSLYKSVVVMQCGDEHKPLSQEGVM